MTESCGLSNYSIDRGRARVRVACGNLPAGHAAHLAVRVEVEEPALRMACAHALSSRNEVAGLLLGRPPAREADGRFLVRVSDYIVGQAVRATPYGVTLTADTWALAHRTKDERYPSGEMMIIGWSHSHPDLSVFYSDYDRFLHCSFFPQPYHIGLVIDPVRRQSDFFVYSTALELVAYRYPWPRWTFEGF